VYADIRHTRLLRGDLDRPQDVARVHRCAELGGEDQAFVGPRSPTASRSVDWAKRCACSVATSGAGIGIDRLDRSVSGSAISTVGHDPAEGASHDDHSGFKIGVGSVQSQSFTPAHTGTG
jgi:hypothetical protein